MKLTLKQIQALEYLLQISEFKKENPENKFNLVIRINNSLWSGNFLNYNLTSTKSFSLDDFDFSIKYNVIHVSEFIKYSKDLKLYSLKNLNNLYLLLVELVNRINQIDLSALDLNPVLYNAINLDTNLLLPFYCQSTLLLHHRLNIQILKCK